MKRLILSAITGRDNQSVDMHRVCLAAGFFVLCGLEIYCVVVLRENFDCMQFGTSTGGMALGFGAGMGAKGSTEPGVPNA